MAQIVTITNPLTGQPAQVDQLDHTAQEIDAAIARALPGGAIDTALQKKANQNLLDNWYFLNPINQRGVTSGNTTPGVYFIDRWLTTYGSATGKYSLDTGGVTLTPATNNSCIMFQRFENVDDLDGKVLTASVLLSNGELFSGTITRVNGNLQWLYLDGSKISLYMDANNEFSICVYVNPLTITAVKLELGDQQTLAHQSADGNWVLNEIPNYGEQLGRCQRYYRQFNAYAKFIAQYIDGTKVVFVLPVSMRTAPGMSGDWKIYTGFTEQTGFTLSAYQTGNIIVIEAVKANHGLTSAWLGVGSDGYGILDADL